MAQLNEFKGDMLLEQAVKLIAEQYNVDAKTLSEMVNSDLNKSIQLLEEAEALEGENENA